MDTEDKKLYIENAIDLSIIYNNYWRFKKLIFDEKLTNYFFDQLIKRYQSHNYTGDKGYKELVKAITNDSNRNLFNQYLKMKIRSYDIIISESPSSGGFYEKRELLQNIQKDLLSTKAFYF